MTRKLRLANRTSAVQKSSKPGGYTTYLARELRLTECGTQPAKPVRVDIGSANFCHLCIWVYSLSSEMFELKFINRACDHWVTVEHL